MEELEPMPIGHQDCEDHFEDVQISNEGKEVGEVGHMATQESKGENHHMGQKEDRSRIELKVIPHGEPVQCNRRI